MEEVMTVSDVAKKYGVGVREVLYALKTGKLEGQKVGWIWLFVAADLPKIWPVRRKTKRKGV